MGKTDRVRVKSDREVKPAEIGVLIYPGVQVSAVGGLTDLFVTANRLSMERCAAGSRTLRITHWKFGCSSAQVECVYDTHGGEHEALVALILPPSLDFDPDRDCDAFANRVPARVSAISAQRRHHSPYLHPFLRVLEPLCR